MIRNYGCVDLYEVDLFNHKGKHQTSHFSKQCKVEFAIMIFLFNYIDWVITLFRWSYNFAEIYAQCYYKQFKTGGVLEIYKNKIYETH